MYKLYMPITTAVCDDYGPELIERQLREAGADRVFLCPSAEQFWTEQNREIESLRRNTEYFKSRGFEVGVWVWTFMHPDGAYTYMTAPDGTVSASNVCPTDLAYREEMGAFVEKAAACGVDVFMFDDDFRFGYIDIGYGCCCENHRAMIREDLGREVSAEELRRAVTEGGENEVRSAFLRANGRSLEEFARDMRRHLDRVDPTIRMGFCSCISSWDFDGTNPDRIAKCLAGNTRPFYRLIGAPYWANDRSWGHRLADVIELERLEAARREDPEIEMFSEGDTYPRPRFKVPAAYLEAFDTALRTAGCMDGILKYMLDYSAHPHTETGYLAAHAKHRALYTAIAEMFDGKESAGIRVWDEPHKFEHYVIPKALEGSRLIQDLAFSRGARLLSATSLPAVYGAAGTAGIALGEDARAVPDDMLSSGLVLDLTGARILSERGVDVGIVSVGEEKCATHELFAEKSNRVAIPGSVNYRSVKIAPTAVTESVFPGETGSDPASFRYENAAGQRFLVYCWDAYFVNEGMLRQYPRAEQLIAAVPWLCGKSIPAVCPGHPDLYMQVKEKGNRLACALWNLFPDPMDEPVVTLAEPPVSVRTISGKATIDGNRVILSEIPPYGFAAFEVER